MNGSSQLPVTGSALVALQFPPLFELASWKLPPTNAKTVASGANPPEGTTEERAVPLA